MIFLLSSSTYKMNSTETEPFGFFTKKWASIVCRLLKYF